MLYQFIGPYKGLRKVELFAANGKLIDAAEGDGSDEDIAKKMHDVLARFYAGGWSQEVQAGSLRVTFVTGGISVHHKFKSHNRIYFTGKLEELPYHRRKYARLL